MLLLRGEHVSQPSRPIVQQLVRLAPRARTEVVLGAGHMGPMSHAVEVAGRIASHIRLAAMSVLQDRCTGEAACAA